MRTIVLLAVLLAVVGCNTGNRGDTDTPPDDLRPVPVKPKPTVAQPSPTAPKQENVDTSWFVLKPGGLLAHGKLPDPADHFEPQPPAAQGGKDPKKPDPKDLPQFPKPGDVIGDKKQPDPMDKKTKPEAPSLNSKILGKTIDQWIEQLSSKDPSRSQQAIRAILQFGPELSKLAVPKFNKMLESYWGLDVGVKVNVIMALGMILDEENEPFAADVAAAVKNMTKILQYDTHSITKLKTTEALGNLGAGAASAVPQLIDMASEKNSWEIREAACYALGRTGYDKKTGPNLNAVNALYGRLAIDDAYQVRLAAIQALTYIGPPPKGAQQEALYKALADVEKKDSEPVVKIWAHMAMMSLDGKANPYTVGKIAAFLQDKDVAVRVQAVQSLCTLGKDAKSEVPALIAALDDQEKVVAAWAVLALSRLEKDAAPAANHLKKIVGHKDWPPAFKDVAQKTLDIIEGKTAPKDSGKMEKDKGKEKQK